MRAEGITNRWSHIVKHSLTILMAFIQIVITFSSSKYFLDFFTHTDNMPCRKPVIYSCTQENMKPKVRVTAILVERNHILLLEQDVTKSRRWSLPGGTLEWSETIEACLIREMKEETGLDVSIGELLYVCDRIQDDMHVVHMTFLVQRTGGELHMGYEPEKDANPIRSLKMVPVAELEQYSFSKIFQELALNDFPHRGSYQGTVVNIGL
jgi:ADP-ribose pyrophosphatase YjhB (NUDIX family)